jgi:hypothetical protein
MTRHYTDEGTTDVVPRLDIPAIYALKLKLLSDLKAMESLEKHIDEEFTTISTYSPARVDWDYGSHHASSNEKYVDRACWRYLVNLFNLDRYMLCTDYERLTKEIEEYETPVFTIENAEAWLAGLKSLIYDNVKTLVKQVFKTITEGTYHVGGWNGPEKKRNNNGVDKRFILHTSDNYGVFSYSSTPTVTDDLEKVCYILAGKTLPDRNAKDVMRGEKKSTFECEYFSLKVCENGNTHYVLSDEIRDKLNLYGPEGAIIGENVKIKILEKEAWR